MIRGIASGVLAIVIAVALAAPGASAQEPGIDGPVFRPTTRPANPPVGPIKPTPIPPVLCTDAAKADLLRRLRADLGVSSVNAEKAASWRTKLLEDQRASGGLGEHAAIYEPAGSDPVFDNTIAMPEKIRALIAKVEAQDLTDCRDPKKVLPKIPAFSPAPWAKRSAFCTQADLDAYKREITKVAEITDANVNAASDHRRTLEKLKALAGDPTKGLTQLKGQIEQAVRDFEPIYQELLRDYGEAAREARALPGLKVAGCSEPTKTPAPPPPPLPQPPTPPPGPPKLSGHASMKAPGCDMGLLAVINDVRANPGTMADKLVTYRSYFRGIYVTEPGHPVAATIEGVAAVDNAIADLRKRQPAPSLWFDARLADASSRLAEDLGPKGKVGHTGSDGSTLRTRMQDTGVYASVMEEDVSLAQTSAFGIIRQLVIDDGVPSRGHRDVVFNPDLKLFGFGGAPHTIYGGMCVMDFAGGFMSAPPPPPPPP